MWQLNQDRLANELGDHFGLEMVAQPIAASGAYPSLELRPTGVHENDAFSIRLELDWRSISFNLILGAFASHLIAEMGQSSEAQRQMFAGLASTFVAKRANVQLRINGEDVNPLQPDHWPQSWQRIHLSLTKSPALVNTEDHAANDLEVSDWTRRFMSLALALMPIEELEVGTEHNPEGLPEGARYRVSVNRYERSRINRAACIGFHGNSCLVCGFNFLETFGDRGADFIHVHHVVPVSKLGAGYRIDPTQDLVPLCPNCHAMAHRSDPPAAITELKALLGR